MHASILHLECAEFMVRETAAPRARLCLRDVGLTLERRLAGALQRLRSAHELAGITADQWAVGDYGISRWQA